MIQRHSIRYAISLMICLGLVGISCKSDPKPSVDKEVSTPTPTPTDKVVNSANPDDVKKKAYEVTIDPSSLCYQRDDKGDILQLRYTSDGSRIKGVYNSLTKDQSKMRTGVITGFISNSTIKSVYSYREGSNTTRQGLTIEVLEDHIVITHPDENGRTEKLSLVDCGKFK